MKPSIANANAEDNTIEVLWQTIEAVEKELDKEKQLVEALRIENENLKKTIGVLKRVS